MLFSPQATLRSTSPKVSVLGSVPAAQLLKAMGDATTAGSQQAHVGAETGGGKEPALR